MPATTDTASHTSPTFSLPSFEEATESIKDLNEKWLESSKSAGLVTLDAYEKAVTSIMDVEKKVAADTGLEWVSALATTHAKVISDLTSSYTTTVRELLK